MVPPVSVRAPGRVNLIGEHTDYNQGLALPMAIDRATTVHFAPDGSDRLRLRSHQFAEPADVSLDCLPDPSSIPVLQPVWARIAIGLVVAMAGARPRPTGGDVRIESDVPVGAGLSSSAALCVALARSLGAPDAPLAVARLCQHAEALAGSEVGLMDPLASMAGRQGHALLIDFSTLEWEPVNLGGAAILVVHSGAARRLADSPYGVRRAECAAAAAAIGLPLGRASLGDVGTLRDPVLRRRARHVVTECTRVRSFVALLRDGDLVTAGRVLSDSHRSQAEDFEVSTPEVDQLVGSLAALRGVHGARMTGGGFGGCVVALADPGAVDLSRFGGRAREVAPSTGARVIAGPARITGPARDDLEDPGSRWR